MTLRKLLTFSVCLFAALLVAAAATLAWSSTLLRRFSDELVHNVQVVDHAKDLSLRLYQHRYYDRLATVQGRPADMLQRDRAKAAMHESLEELITVVNEEIRMPTSLREAPSTTRKRVWRIQESIDLYLLNLEEAHHAMDPDIDTVFNQVSPQFQSVQQMIQETVDVANSASTASQQLARRLDDQMNLASSILGMIGVVLGILLIRLLWLRLYHPALALEESMRRYAAGDTSARAAVSHPREFASIGASFNALADRLEEQSAARLRFLAAVAHDLRNPLSSLRLYTDSIRPDRPLPDEARIRRTLQALSQQIGRLNRMTGDLLEGARIEAGQLTLEPETFDLMQLSRDVLNLFEAGAPQHRLHLAGPDRLEITADPTRIHQVLTNLISNAIKYSPAGGEVRLEVTLDSSQVRLAVTDQGLGMTAEEIDRLFEPFRRSGGLKDEIPGVGLGLFSTRRIVEGHAGRIEVRSEPGHGSTFTVSLPMGV